MVRDPGNRTDQEADDIYREPRGERQQRMNHSSIVDICPEVLQVYVENKQGNCKGDHTVAERFKSTLGHGAPPSRSMEEEWTWLSACSCETHGSDDNPSRKRTRSVRRS